MTDKHRMVVVGGGFGGLNVTRGLRDADVDITLVDRTNHHLFQPLLYQVAAGILPPGLIAPALRGVIKKEADARLLADVQGFDLTGGWWWRRGRTAVLSSCPTTRSWWRPARRTPTSARISSPSTPRG